MHATLLKQAYQPRNLEAVMCCSLLAVDWRGCVYDCDFNPMLDLPLASPRKVRAAAARSPHGKTR